MAIDFHAHLAREDPEAPPFMRDLFDVDGYLERQAEAQIDLTVLSYALDEEEAAADALDKAKAEHDFLTDLVARYPDRFSALAAVDPFGGDAWLAEAERALDSGFAGYCFPTSRGGRYLDSAEAQDALALADEHGALIFLHPSDSPVDVERLGNAMVAAWIGRPYETGICLSRMLLADTLSGYPNLRVVVAHSGGALPMLLGRLDQVYEGLQRVAAFAGGGGPPGGGPPGGGRGKGPPGGAVPKALALEPALEGPRPSERIDQFYFDTASYHPASVRASIATVGVDRVVLGSDYPPAGDSPKEAVDLINGLDLTADERDKILSGNARRLLESTRAPVH